MGIDLQSSPINLGYRIQQFVRHIAHRRISRQIQYIDLVIMELLHDILHNSNNMGRQSCYKYTKPIAKNLNDDIFRHDHQSEKSRVERDTIRWLWPTLGSYTGDTHQYMNQCNKSQRIKTTLKNRT